MKKILTLIIFINTHYSFCQTPVYYPGYPKEIDSLRGVFDKSCVPLITDLDKDGQKEIVTVAMGFKTPYHVMYVIKSDGSNFPGFPKGFNEPVKDIASGDVDGDGYLDIAIRSKNFINVINRFGNNLPGFPVNYLDNPSVLRKFISIYDLDNDSKLEIIVSIEGELNVFSNDGQVRSGWPKRITGQALNNPAIGDIDNDGFAEIILTSYRQLSMGADSGSINIFRHNGNIFSNNWPIHYDSLYITFGASPSIWLNRNHTDSTFIIIPAYRSITSPKASMLNRLTKYSIYGNPIDISYQETYSGFGTFSMGDINRDGKLEYSSGTQFGQYFTAYNFNLSIMNGWPNQGGGEFEATTVVGKLSNENNLSLAVNNWAAFNPDGHGYIFAYNTNGIPFHWSPLRPIGLVEGISLSDINNDGSVELIATSQLGTISTNEFYLHVWTIPGIPYTNENFPWPQYGHDRYRSNQYGFIPPDDPVGIQPINSIVPDKFILHQNFPNPFNPTTNIKFAITISSNIKLSLYDELGREMETLINEQLRPGTYSLTFDGSNYNSGIYFYRLTSENYTESKKMLLVK